MIGLKQILASCRHLKSWKSQKSCFCGGINGMRKMKIRVHKSLLFFSFAIGWIAVSITPLFDTIIVTSEYDLTKHRLGFPLPIIEQHTSLTALEDAFPFQLGMINPQEHPSSLLLGNY